MPFQTWDTKADFDKWYDVGAEGAWGHPNTRPEIRLHYHRFPMIALSRQRAARLVPLLGWGFTTRVCILGCGFAWLCEALQELGIQKAIGVDTSLYINAEKGNNEDSDLTSAIRAAGLQENLGDGLTLFNTFRGDGGARAKLSANIKNETLASAQSRNRVRDAAGGAGFEVISENLLPSFTDAEILSYTSNVDKMAIARVIHFLDTIETGLTDTVNWNCKTLADWKALLPTHLFVEIGTYRIL